MQMSVSQSVCLSVSHRPHATDLPAQTAHSAGKFDFICAGLQDCRATAVQVKVSVGAAKGCSDVSEGRAASSETSAA